MSIGTASRRLTVFSFAALAASLQGCSGRSASGDESATAAVEVDKELDAEFESPYRGFSFRYPSSWKIEVIENDDPYFVTAANRVQHRIKLTSPSGAIRLGYDDTVYGIGGCCSYRPFLVDSRVAKDSLRLPGFQPLRFVESVIHRAPDVDYTGDGYDLTEGLAEGDYAVSFGLVDVDGIREGEHSDYVPFWLAQMEEDVFVPYFMFSVESDGALPSQRFQSKEEALAYFEQPEYLQAKKILLSLEAFRSPAPVAAGTPFILADIARVNSTDGLNLRGEASQDGAILTVLPNGSRAVVTGETVNGFVPVVYKKPGTIADVAAGWVFNELIQHSE